MTHDPLCPTPGRQQATCTHCQTIELARTDERAKHSRVTFAMVAEVGKAAACDVYVDDVCVFSGVQWIALAGAPVCRVEP